ncbi:MAG: holin [Bermanella sp.]
MNPTDIFIERAASVSTYASSGVSVLGAVAANDVAQFGGLIVAVLALAVNWYYRHKTFQQEKKLNEAQLKKIEESR